jgi:DNA-binding CsgD family transcriptional regulator
LPAAVEDLAVVLAERGQLEEARAALNEAVGVYEGLNARWDIRRADSRLRPYGIRRGVRGPRGPRAASGWAALTATEVKIAALVARGDSTSEIARGMFLSRRTVQTYISHILAKLGAKSRVEIVREALRQGISALAATRRTANDDRARREVSSDDDYSSCGARCSLERWRAEQSRQHARASRTPDGPGRVETSPRIRNA